ncbi:hypothetical protein OAD61_00440 [bacterium]|nr:hypothetical protein [bacterium]
MTDRLMEESDEYFDNHIPSEKDKRIAELEADKAELFGSLKLSPDVVNCLGVLIGAAGVYPDGQHDSKGVDRACDVIQEKILDCLSSPLIAKHQQPAKEQQ